MNSGASLKASIPAWFCLLTLVYCTAVAVRVKHTYFPPGTRYNVEVTVTGPDGQAIPPAGPASR